MEGRIMFMEFHMHNFFFWHHFFYIEKCMDKIVFTHKHLTSNHWKSVLEDWFIHFLFILISFFSFFLSFFCNLIKIILKSASSCVVTYMDACVRLDFFGFFSEGGGQTLRHLFIPLMLLLVGWNKPPKRGYM